VTVLHGCRNGAVRNIQEIARLLILVIAADFGMLAGLALLPKKVSNATAAAV
jgi:hypothetical protein